MNLPLPANDLCHPEPPQTAKQKQASQSGGVWFVPPPPSPSDSGESRHVESAEADAGEGKRAKRPRRTPRTYHPKYVEAARELCARFLDEVNDQGLLPEGWTQGKYDVSRPQLLQGTTEVTEKIRLLDAA